jgi:Legionella pneumophila major outer membrane protein precursor
MRKFVLLGLFGLTQLSALGGCGDFGGSVDYLYWKPANFAGSFNLVEREGEGGKVFETEALVDPSYQSGVRGEIWWRPECSSLSLIGRYYWVEPRHSQDFVGFDDGNERSQFASMEVLYHAADLLLAYQFCLCNCFQLDLLGGGHVLYTAINVKSRFRFPNENDFQREEAHNRVAGGGASLGLAAAWDIWCGLRAFAEGRYGVIYGSSLEAGVRVRTGVRDTTTVFTPSSFQVWTREFDLRLGGRYDWSCGCSTIGLELGWEARVYVDFPRLDSGFETPSDFDRFGKAIGGPFIGLTGRF